MKFLLVDYDYPEFLRSFDRGRSVGSSYAEEMAALDQQLFGEVAFQARALRALGHDASHVVVNAYRARRAWATEHDLTIGREWTLALKRGGPLRIRPRRVQGEAWMWSTLEAEVREVRPDVLHVSAVDFIPPDVINRLKRHAGLVVGQIAAKVRPGSIVPYDVLVSSIPDLVRQFGAAGKASIWLPLAFESTIRPSMPTAERDIDVSFIGSFSRDHRSRVAVLEAIARVAPVRIWTRNRSDLPRGSPLRDLVAGSAYGRRMYEILGRSRISVNTHVQVAGADANNLRLFEATGMGALLVTDAKRNLGDLFDVGQEVVAYDSPDSAAALVRHHLDDPQRAAAIAARGQARTLRDHTWGTRMAEYATRIQELHRER